MSARNRNRYLYGLVFTVGIATLGAEIAAARLLAPFFGSSTIVWANTIGIVLVALSVGYWYGGRLGDRHPNVRALSTVVIVGAGLVALIPFVAQPFFDVAIGALDEIEAGAFVGSLVAVLALIAVPVGILGTASPWAIRLAVDSVESSGQTAGRLYAVSTVGSLLGTMLAALVLIPLLGTQRTFLVLALSLALVAAIPLGWRFALAPVALAGALAIPVGTVKATDDGTILYEKDSEHQYIRVIEEPDGDRILELNEGQAIHSIWRPDSFLTGGEWDGYLVLPFAGLNGPPERVAILGNAAGSTARAYGEFLPHTLIDGVEIDPLLEEVGNRFFEMDSNENLTVYSEDARPWLRRSDGGYDGIFVDAYRQPYIPFYLATTEFFELAKDRLRPGGVLIVNAGHPEGNDDLEKVLGRTMASVFPTVMRDPIEATNTMLIASEAPLSAEKLRRGIGRAGVPVEVQNLAAIQAARLGPRLPGGTVYTDDRAPVEWLIDRSILNYAGDN